MMPNRSYRLMPLMVKAYNSWNGVRNYHSMCNVYSFSNSKLQTLLNRKHVETQRVNIHSGVTLSSKPKEKDMRLNFHKDEARLWTIPNLLCVVRIVASPVVCYCILNTHYNFALGILLVAGFTDFADGQIARHFPNQASKIGTFLDPLADKVLVVSLYSTLAYTELVPGVLTLLIVFRDVLLLAAGVYIRYLSLPPPKTLKKFLDGSHSLAELKPTYLSKINTVIQLFIAAFSLYAPNISSLPDSVLKYSWYIAGCSTVLSGISYAVDRKRTYSITPKIK